MENIKYEGPDRRKNLRVTYKPAEMPALKVGENEFKVADFSEWVLRLYDSNIEFGHWVRGELTLLCGESIDVKGMVVKKERENTCITLLPHIEKEILVKELQHIKPTSKIT